MRPHCALQVVVMRLLSATLTAAIPAAVSSFAVSCWSTPRLPLAVGGNAAISVASSSKNNNDGLLIARHRRRSSKLCASDRADPEAPGEAGKEIVVEIKGGIKVRFFLMRLSFGLVSVLDHRSRETSLSFGGPDAACSRSLMSRGELSHDL